MRLDVRATSETANKLVRSLVAWRDSHVPFADRGQKGHLSI
jgi:hypothetical protein